MMSLKGDPYYFIQGVDEEEYFGTGLLATTQKRLWNLFENPHHSCAAKVSLAPFRAVSSFFVVAINRVQGDVKKRVSFEWCVPYSRGNPPHHPPSSYGQTTTFCWGFFLLRIP